ncbi:MAG TPA: alpha/beta fold hydrolase [Candidatus Acidoferrum sp.]|jgi:pimeloyl-ACP methyl ester carboxylesterase|nr:alpha/beta fold hydrolase [Candidatus Acidoferrum sp.]
MKIGAMWAAFLASAILIGSSLAVSASADDGERLLTIDHYVPVHSTVPAMSGQLAEIYVRERVMAGVAARSASLSGRVALFVHGAGTPAEVSFDIPHTDYSWMAYLAREGYDVFAMDTTGYGRSTHPAEMNDLCNLSAQQQAALIPAFLPAPCPPSYPHQMTTIASDWNDIGAVVDFIRGLRHVDKLNLLGWSLGGPRAGGWAAQHPEKVEKLVLLAPAYNRTSAAAPPPKVPADGAAMAVMAHERFLQSWNEQVGCPNEYNPDVAENVWAEMVASDPVAATWSTGMRRSPNVTVWGWTQDAVAKMTMPVLMVSGQYDRSVPQDRVRDLYNDLPGHNKVFVDLACSSHYTMWEGNHLLLFQASLEWLNAGTVNGKQEGMLRLGYPDADAAVPQTQISK